MRTINVLFDLDGTLVDTLPGIDYSMRATVAQVLPGVVLPVDLRPFIGPPLRKVFHLLHPSASPEELDTLEKTFRLSYDAEGWRRSLEYPGVRETLERLQENEVTCFVVTNKQVRISTIILEHFGLRKFFKEIVSPDIRTPRFGCKTESLAYVITQHNLLAADSFFVGDSQDDARAAQDCNVAFLAATYGYGNASAQENVLGRLTQFSEVLGFLPQ